MWHKSFAGERTAAFFSGEAGIGRLQENGCEFALLLDASGDVAWDWQKPEEIAGHFSAGEIAAFSKWYLEGYPVVVWRYEDGGLLVFGYPKESIVRYNLAYEMSDLERGFGYVGDFFRMQRSADLWDGACVGIPFLQAAKAGRDGDRRAGGGAAGKA